MNFERLNFNQFSEKKLPPQHPGESKISHFFKWWISSRSFVFLETMPEDNIKDLLVLGCGSKEWVSNQLTNVLLLGKINVDCIK